jgi:hypothetical protein
MNNFLKTYRRDAIIFFCLLLFCFSYFYQVEGWNENSRFNLIFALIEEGHLEIDNYIDAPANYTRDVAYNNGHFYSDKAIGPALIGTVIYIPLNWIRQTFSYPSVHLSKKIITNLVIGLPSAIVGGLLFIFTYYLSKNRFQAFWITLSLTLGTMIFPFSTTFFSHVLTASLLFCGFLMIFYLGETPQKKRKPIFFLIIGFLFGLALISDFPSTFIIIILVIYYFYKVYWTAQNKIFPNILFPIIGAAIPILFQLTYNKLCFGGFFSFGYNNEYIASFQDTHSQGVLGITLPDLRALFYMVVHPSMGLIWQSPFILLTFIGLLPIIKSNRKKPELLFSGLITGLYIIIMSGAYNNWWGGAAFGARHIIPVLLFFSIPLSYIPKRSNWILPVLGIISIGQMLLVTSTSVEIHSQVDWSWSTVNLKFFEYSQIYDYSLKQFVNGNFTNNIGNVIFGLDSWMSLIPFFIIVTAIICFFFWKNIRLIFHKKAI